MTLVEQLLFIRDRQIAHIREYQDKFEADKGKGRNVEDYFRDYWDMEYPNDIYRGLCHDLDLLVRKECLDE